MRRWAVCGCVLLLVGPVRALYPAQGLNNGSRGRVACSTRGGGARCLRAALEDTQVSYFTPLSREDTPSPGAKTRELPIFPLSLVTCPNGKCPLHIFEMRYRQLMNNIAGQDNRFGIIMFDPNTQQIAGVGTVVEVVERSLLPDGRQLVMNIGRERFKLLRVTQEKPYMVGLVELGLVDEEPEEGQLLEGVRGSEARVWGLLQEVVRLSNKVYDKTKVTVSEDVARAAPAAAAAAARDQEERARRSAFSFAVTEMLDIPPRAKQLMLQTLNIGERLDYQAELLDKAQKFLAAQATLKDALG
ncbi:PUA-like domain-containing protein [Tribonema minus]|uniref:PUA-like domain-containing protein n=1 Tax=Tribonema minus TaxID=303371 RepID=A0A836CM26_9STRA|nr:PUA-like domain-containing protein [Tribonema minus]